MPNVTIIHNPRCSKSREALAIIESKSHEAVIIDYLNGGLSNAFLEEILGLLKIPAKELLRTKEEEFKGLSIDLDNQDEVISAILECPKLLERPIVIKDGKAVIGRPPERILDLF